VRFGDLGLHTQIGAKARQGAAGRGRVRQRVLTVAWSRMLWLGVSVCTSTVYRLLGSLGMATET